MLNKPIFILGAHKSGTTLLRNLLDGHPDLFVIPVETHPFQMARAKVMYALRRTSSKNITVDQIKSNFSEWMKHLLKSNDIKGGGLVDENWDLKKFDQYLQDSDSTTLPDLFEDYFKATYYALTSEPIPDGVRIVEKSVENMEFVAELINMFPDAKFVHIVRNPYANLVSIRKYKTKSGYPNLTDGLKSLWQAEYFLEKNLRLIDNYFVVKYEDLVLDTLISTQNIAEYLELEFTDSFLTPTVFSKPCQNNSMYNIKETGVFSGSLKNWEKEITPFEIFLVNKYLSNFCDTFDYKKIYTKKSRYRFNPGEGIKNFIANRILLSKYHIID